MPPGTDENSPEQPKPLGYASPSVGRTTPHLTLTALSIFFSLSAHICWVVAYFLQDPNGPVTKKEKQLMTALACSAGGLAVTGFVIAAIAWVKWHTDLEFLALLIPMLLIFVALSMPIR